MSPAPNIAVNLLSQDDFSSSAAGKVLLWALSIGRYIVVFTELIVILSFLSRFKLDRNLTDLNQEIVKQKAIILSYGELEENMRYTQDKLKFVRQKTPPVTATEMLNILSRSTPTDVRMEKLALQNDSVRISATALSTHGFSFFVNSLALKDEISEVTLGAVSSEDDGVTISFDLLAGIETVTE